MSKSFEHRQGESSSFASTGLCRRHHVATTDHRWNGLFLNRRRVDVPLFPQRLEKGFSESQVFETDL
ncbi:MULTISPECIES: hypothetical protein [unclassified Synechococcus]|uniref:hypothetical protein n=1 Tax=unclassified Synechococcus TaxID=2626047 RepID=UPI001E2F4FA2|nr:MULTISPECIES: hypothetical protein [unclassified Synechococcus]